MKQLRRSFPWGLSALIGLWLSASWVQAEEKSVGAVFLDQAAGSRPAAMGEAFSAAAEDANALYWNPAGLVRNTGTDLLFTHTFFIQGFRDEYLAFGLPLSGQDAVGVNAFFSYASPMEKTSLDSSEISSFGAYDAYAGLAWSHAFSRQYSAGILLKGIYQAIDTYSALSAAADLGVLARGWLPDLNLAMVVRNLGTPIRFIQESYRLPAEVDFSAAYRGLNKNLLLVVETEIPFQLEACLKAGAEYNVEDLLFVRAGYKYDLRGNDLGALSGLTAGLGFMISDYKLDYAYSPYGILGDVHRVSLTFPFRRSAVEEEKIIQRLEKDIRVRQENMIRGYLKTAEARFAKGDFSNAVLYYEKILALNPQYPAIPEKISLANGKMVRAEANRHFQDGMKSYQRTDYLPALIEWNKVAEIVSDYPEIKNWLDKANQKLLQSTRPTDGGPAPAALKANPKVEQYLNLGMEYLRAGHYPKAIDAWQEVLRLAPEYQQAKNLIQSTRNKMQEEINGLLQEAKVSWQDEKWVQAVQLWRQVLSLSPNQPEALQQLEINQFKIRQVANDLYIEGVNNYVQNKLYEAVVNFKDLLVLDPENQKAKKHLESVKRKIEEIKNLQN